VIYDVLDGQKQEFFEYPKNFKDLSQLDQMITLLQLQPEDTGFFTYCLPNSRRDPYDLKPLILSKNNADG